MKLALPTLLFLFSSSVSSAAVPQPDAVARDALPVPHVEELPDLEKRRGGGGGGRSGGGGFSGGGGGGRSGSSSSGGRGGSSGGSHGGGERGGQSSSSRASSNSNRGGTTRYGSGVVPHYGRIPGGNAVDRFYAGGAVVPYAAGHRSPSGLTPFLLPAAALAFLPGLWLYGAYLYPYNNPYRFVNQTTNQNQTIPVVCVCAQFAECSCDGNHYSSYFHSLFNGQVPHNTSKVKVLDVNGTEKIYINGTLPNGTTAEQPMSPATRPADALMNLGGYWVMAATVAAAVWLV